MKTGLKTTFLVHGVMMTAFGLIYIFFPVQWAQLTGCLSDQLPNAFRLLGTTLLGFAAGSFLAFRETSWDRVELVAQLQCIATTLFAVVILVLFVVSTLPAIGWMYFAVMAGLAIAFNVTTFTGRPAPTGTPEG